MANTNAPFGARPVRHRAGAPYNGAATLYYATTGATYPIAVGDFVSLTGSSNSVAYAGNPIGSLQTVTLSVGGTGTASDSTNVIVGVVVGVHPVQASDTTYLPVSTSRGVYVADDPDLIFEIQDSGAATLAYTDVGSGFAIDTSTNATSTATGYSGMTMDTTAANATLSIQLRMQGLSKIKGNALGKYAVWDVMINNHAYANRQYGN